jgi:putative transposase
MSDYRRWLVPGGTYFFTVVTHEHRPIFRDPSAVRLLGSALRDVRETLPFETVAIVVLWDHLHCVWSLPSGDDDFPTRWQRVKATFTDHHLAGRAADATRTATQSRRGERRVWQRRFWEHVIRDEHDLENHVDYIHYNPVKHGYVASPADWPWSSFGRFVASGHYPTGWGRSEPIVPYPSPRE